MLRFRSILVLLAAVLIAGCGGAKAPQGTAATGGAGKPSVRTLSADAYKYSDCMRKHGVNDFQDPHVSSTNGHQSMSVRIDPSIVGSPDFESAQRACAHLMPGLAQTNTQDAAQQQAHTHGLLAFAACMRKRGFSRFPDPNDQGQLTLQMIQGAGINLKEPAVEPAADACASVTHGEITKADIAQAIANPNESGHQEQAAAP